jgi:hypothetical protein
MVENCRTCWFLFHFILLLLLGGGGHCIPFYVFTLTRRKTVRSAVARKTAAFCVCLKSSIPVHLESKWARFLRPKLTQSSLYLRYLCCNNRVWMSDVRNWVWYRQDKAKYTQGPLYRYSAAEMDFTVVWQILFHFQTVVFWASLPV